LTARRYRYHPARYMKGSPQVHPRSVRGRLNWRRPARSRFIRGRSLHSAAHPPTGQAWPAARRGQSKAIPRYQQRSRDCPGIPRVSCVGQTLDPPVIFPELGGFFTEDGRPTKSRNQRFGEPPASASPPRVIRPNPPPGRAHDRGRCPLYVRAQLETAGLTGTQRDLRPPKATAREAGNPQLTGRFRR